MILLRPHPDVDVRRTVTKHNALAGFAVSQKAHGVTIREDQIRQVQHDDGIRSRSASRGARHVPPAYVRS
jgi:hypothetical protein